MVENKPTVGYWGIRGLGAYVRMTLEAAGKEYNDVQYSNGDDWFKRDKPTIKVLIPNLPYYLDGDVGISETDSIMRTVARMYKPDLLGKGTASDQAFVENMFSFIMKWNGPMRGLCYSEADDAKRKGVFENNKF